MKEILAADVECYRNYFLIKFRNLATGNMRDFEQFEGQKLDVETVRKILQHYQIITFNGKNYDLPMIMYALTGANCDQLKTASDAIILGGVKPWEFERQFNVKIPTTIDMIDIFDVAPGLMKSSLKIYAGRLHARKMQDLPIEPGALIAPEKREELRLYCGNDLVNTELLFNYLKPQIELREKMSKEYGIDLRSKSDAQIAEAVIGDQVEKIKGEKVYRPPVYPGTGFKYKAPEFIGFNAPHLKDLLLKIQETTFMIGKKGSVELPDMLADLKIPIGRGIYRLGLGGIHSSEESVAHVANDEILIMDHDVQSYYPSIISSCNLYPKHIGTAFLSVYKGFIKQRLEAKAAKNKITSEVLKIFLNGSFGKFGSKWSKLYSPELLIQTTVTGQLALLMLIEMFEERGIEVISANTDGVVTKCFVERDDELLQILRAWEIITGFVLESNVYRGLYSRDVNNYLAIKANDYDEVKTKGAFAAPGLSKNPRNEVCIEALTRFLVDKIAIEKTIRDCKDITKFVTIQQVKGGAVKGETYLGKAVRFYYANGITGTINYKSNGNTVPRSEGAKPCMDLPAEFPDDINYDWYITEAKSILKDIGYYGLFI